MYNLLEESEDDSFLLSFMVIMFGLPTWGVVDGVWSELSQLAESVGFFALHMHMVRTGN
jgi:hypothetical protein